MPSLFQLKSSLSGLLLRGELLRTWNRRKTKKLDYALTTHLVKESGRPASPEHCPSFRSRLRLESILFICDNMWEEDSLLPELRKICPVRFLNLNPALKGHPQPSWSRITATQVKKFAEETLGYEPGLIFFYARPALLSEEVFATLRRRWSCPLVGMNLDDKVEFLDYRLFSKQPGNYQEWAKLFDLNITNTVVATDWYRNRSLPVYYMPPGFRSRAEFAYPAKAKFKYELSFLGSCKPERAILMERLKRYGVDVRLFGYGWLGSQPVEQPETVFRASMLNLGIGLASPSETLTTTKARDFECPGAGGCYLTTYNWELCEHYEIGKEILCYRNLEELLEIYAFYRRRPEICLKIAHAAYLRCQNEHTWEKRFRKLFLETGLATG